MTAAIKEYIGTWILWRFTRPLWLIDRAWLWACPPDKQSPYVLPEEALQEKIDRNKEQSK
jgi:hypothetical protein